jgi:hypothetical protein
MLLNQFREGLLISTPCFGDQLGLLNRCFVFHVHYPSIVISISGHWDEKMHEMFLINRPHVTELMFENRGYQHDEQYRGPCTSRAEFL